MVGSTPTFTTYFISSFFTTLFGGVASCAIAQLLPNVSKTQNGIGVMLMKLGLLMISLIGAGTVNPRR